VEQEVADFLGLTFQYLFDEVVNNEAVVASEAGDESVDVVAALHRQRGQLQRAAAIQPSVRASSAPTLFGVSSKPMASLKYAAASSAVKRKSAARISKRSRRALSRASGSGWSVRLATTRWIEMEDAR
jgi:hypothetical protein